ncbi:MAG: J domain-containing protein [Ginsengibacter sp.]
MIEAFPLHWPVGYSRSKTQISSRFKVTMDKSQRFLRDEVRKLKATDLIISTNVPVKSNGLLYADWMRRKIEDPGAAIYFKYNGKDVAMCCDQNERVWENIYALGKGIEALRGMERWGVSEFIERAFTGFKALPESVVSETCFSILGISPESSLAEIKAAYFSKAKTAHPDAGGNNEDFNKIKLAYDQACDSTPK